MSWQDLLQVIVIVDFFIVHGSYSLLTLLAFPAVRTQHRRAFIDDYPHVFRSRLAPGVSIIVPAYNEEATIVENVDSLLMLRYPQLEVVVVIDGATDATLDVLREHFGLTKVIRVLRDDITTQRVNAVYASERIANLIVIDKQNGGKADALNAGINASNHPYFVSVDADVILEEDAVIRVMTPILRNPRLVVAAGGILRVANGCEVRGGRVIRAALSKRTLPVLQVIEYIRAFAAGRAGLSVINSLLIISGAFSAFNTALVREVGGYARDTVGEDMEILVRVRRHLARQKRPYRVLYLAYPVAWTEVPETLKALGRQRARWHRGLSETLWKHRDTAFNPRYGYMGLVAMPFFLVAEFLGPIAEATGYAIFLLLVLTGDVNFAFYLLFLSIAVLWGVLLSLSAVFFEDVNFRWYETWGSYTRLVWLAVLENFGYRQLTVWWRLRGLAQFFAHRRAWGKMERRGFGAGARNGRARS